MNLSQLRSWVQNQTLIPAANEIIDGYINQAYLEIAAAYEWPWLETTFPFDLEDGTSEYALPADMNRLRAVVYSGEGAEAQPQRTNLINVLRRLGNDVGESDLPAEYYRQGNNLVFVPTPSATQSVILVYLAKPTALAGDEEEPAFDSAFHIFLAQEAAALYFESEDSFDHAGYYHQLAASTFAQMTSFYDVQLPSERIIIGGGFITPRPKPYTDWPE